MEGGRRGQRCVGEAGEPRGGVETAKVMFDMGKIERIEKGLQVALPRAYRELLLSYPFADDPDPYGWHMFGHMNTIIGENKAYRKIGFFGPPWPAHYLAIGGDGFGNLYFLDLSRGDETVLFADHDAASEFDGIDMYEEAPNLQNG